MPYLSYNYRHQPRPRLYSTAETMAVFSLSSAAIFLLLIALGWMSS